MSSDITDPPLTVTVVGGPTVVIDLGGLRFVTDPTFDPAHTDYPMGGVTLRKSADPALSADEVGSVTAVLLSHDQHPDNLDSAGREFVKRAPLVLTTDEAAERLGASALGSWEERTVRRPDGGEITVTGVPAQHGPPGSEKITGAVTGFLLSGGGLPTVYVSGDNVSLDPVRALAERTGGVDLAILHLGAAQLAPLGPTMLSMTADQAVEAAQVLGARKVLPVHCEGWEHFTEGREPIAAAFAKAGRAEVLLSPPPGQSTQV